MIERALKHIEHCAQIPSFSSFEERIHPYIESVIAPLRSSGVTLEKVEKNNIVVHVPGDENRKPVVLNAHLDKINHFGIKEPEKVPFERHEEEIEGLLDDSVGLGICLTLIEEAVSSNFAPLYVLFTEMEESKGLKEHPELLKNAGKDYKHGMGAEKLARYLIEEFIEPEAIITIDTTPLFKGDKGVAVYANWWEYYDMKPTKEQSKVTDEFIKRLRAYDPDFRLDNNTNDYLVFGKMYNRNALEPVPCIALEPAIYPYHQADERVHIADIERCLTLLKKIL